MVVTRIMRIRLRIRSAHKNKETDQKKAGSRIENGEARLLSLGTEDHAHKPRMRLVRSMRLVRRGPCILFIYRYYVIRR